MRMKNIGLKTFCQWNQASIDFHFFILQFRYIYLIFKDRFNVIHLYREAITLCSEAAGLKPERRRVVKNIVRQCLTDNPVAKMLNTKLTISTTGIALVIIETDDVSIIEE